MFMLSDTNQSHDTNPTKSIKHGSIALTYHITKMAEIKTFRAVWDNFLTAKLFREICDTCVEISYFGGESC